jgi:hypothetical protein
MSPEEKPMNADSEEKSPTQIRAEIEDTRAELGDTVEALGRKTDVKGQAKAKVDDVKAKAKSAAPESPQEGFEQAQALVKRNPRSVAIAGGVLALLILWRLLRR